MRAFIALGITTMVIVMSLGVVASPVAAASSYQACSEPLNTDRQRTYRFKNGDDVLPFGKVVVTATRQYPNRYCQQFRVGNRFVKHAYNRADFERPDGVCTREKFRVASAGPYEVSDFTRSLRVPENACTFQRYAIKWDGKWWTAKVRRENA